MSARIRSAAATLLIVSTFAIAVWAQRRKPRPVTSKDLLDGLKNTGRWPLRGLPRARPSSPKANRSGECGATCPPNGHSPPKACRRPSFSPASPLVVDGIIYMTGNANMAWAIDARTGKELWRYKRQLPTPLTYGGGNIVNRGFAVLDDRLFMGTLDARLIALDKSNPRQRALGRRNWTTSSSGMRQRSAPLVVKKDKVIVGNSGGDMASRGFLDAYDAKTGARAWRFYTIPGPGEPGSETWSSAEGVAAGRRRDLGTSGAMTPSLISFTGAPAIRIRTTTGAIGWATTSTPRRSWRSTRIRASCAGITSSHRTTRTTGTSNHVPVLTDPDHSRSEPEGGDGGHNRNGFFYTLDRATGELLVAKPYTGTQWARRDWPRWPACCSEPGRDARGDNPTALDHVCWISVVELTSTLHPLDPALELFFVMARESCAIYTPRKQEVQPGRLTNERSPCARFPNPAMQCAALPWIRRPATCDGSTSFPPWSLAGVASTASGIRVRR